MSAAPAIQFRTVDELLACFPGAFERADRPRLAQVLATMPVRLTGHLIEAARGSNAIFRQFLPDVRELGPSAGEREPFVGLLPTGSDAVERMYPDRAVLLAAADCPAACRFCFRKFHRRLGGQGPSRAELSRGIAAIGKLDGVREVLVTGGEPVLHPERLAFVLAGLRELPHVGPIRVACRSLSTAPELVDDEVADLLAGANRVRDGRPLEVAAHINHADELSPPTLAALVRLRDRGVHVYNQAVLLRGVNDSAAALAQLFYALRCHGVETYVLFYPEPLFGIDHLRPSLATAQQLKQTLRRRHSGRCNPRLIVTTRIGKLELGADARIVDEACEGVARAVWIETPYQLQELRELDPTWQLPTNVREGAGGLLEVRYLDGGIPEC